MDWIILGIVFLVLILSVVNLVVLVAVANFVLNNAANKADIQKATRRSERNLLRSLTRRMSSLSQ